MGIIYFSFTFKNFLSVSHFNLVSLKINAKLKYKMFELKEAGHPTFIKKSFYLYFSKKILCFSCYLQPPDRMHLFELKKESYNVNIIVYYIYDIRKYTIYLQLTCIIYLNYFYWYHFGSR